MGVWAATAIGSSGLLVLLLLALWPPRRAPLLWRRATRPLRKRVRPRRNDRGWWTYR